jgi:hypothetical protein
MPVKTDDKNKLRDAIYQAKRGLGQVKQKQARPLPESSEQGAPEKSSKKKSKLIAIIILIGLIIFIVIYSLPSGDSEPSSLSSQPKQEQVSKPTEVEASIIAKDFVKIFLKSPSTAKFPLLEYNSVALPDTEFGKSRYRVSSYVDAQNAFGAMIRNNWTVTMKYLGGEWNSVESWELEELILGGEVIYTIYPDDFYD